MLKTRVLYMVGFLMLAAFLIAVVISGIPQKENALEVALQSAGNNRSELEKVLCRYQRETSDSLKYKAACFLIENMPFYVYSESKQLENYKSYYAWLKPSKGKTAQQVADSVRKVYGSMEAPLRKRDVVEIDSAYLCHNIDWAFKVWNEQPWGKNISFEIFCEYLLPYRIDDEPLAYWREMYYEKYNPLLDSLRMSDSLDIEDPVTVARYLMKRLPDQTHYYTSVVPYSFGHIGPDHVQSLSGTCREVTDFAVYLFRALGIPCAVDYIPMRSTVNVGHFWLTFWDKNGTEYMTNFPDSIESVSRNWWNYKDDSPKIYRYTFSVNRTLHERMAEYGEAVPQFWRLPKFADVTCHYDKFFKEELTIPHEKQYRTRYNGKIAYLCVSSQSNWVPVDWTEYNADRLTFHNVRIGAVMRVATYEDGKLCFLTDPFSVDKESGAVCYYPVEDNREEVVLYAKCDVTCEEMFQVRMVGGVFEGSNRPDFRKKDTLYVIKEKPFRLCTSVEVSPVQSYRYLRYVGPAGSACNVAEVAFYEKGSVAPLSGKVLGTPGCFQQDGTHEYTNVFDGKTWTSFDYLKNDGGWAGLDLERKVRVSRIVYTPRNRDNYIRSGDTYELFYCDRDWKSLGVIQASSDSLKFCGVPTNALLFLHNHTRGKDERIFLYKDGEQIWK